MEKFTREIQVRWADLDPNAHARHSVYYDWGALCRVEFFYACGLTTNLMHRLKIGPILFREEAVFRREINLSDKVNIDLQLAKARKDFSRWTIRHHIMKDQYTLSTIITVDGAWLDIMQRKLAIAPKEVSDVFMQMPRSEDFQWLD